MTATLHTTLDLRGCQLALTEAHISVAAMRAASAVALATRKQALDVADSVAKHGLTKSNALIITALGLGNDALPAVENLNLFPVAATEASTEAFLTELNASVGVGLTVKAVELAESVRNSVDSVLSQVIDAVAQLKDVVDGPMAFADASLPKGVQNAEALLESIERNTKLITDLDNPISAAILGPDLYQQGHLIVTGALEVLRSHRTDRSVAATESLEEAGFNDAVLPALAANSTNLYTAIQEVCDNGGALLAGMDEAIDHIRAQEGADAMKSAELVSDYAQVIVDALADGVRNLADVSALTMVG